LLPLRADYEDLRIILPMLNSGSSIWPLTVCLSYPISPRRFFRAAIASLTGSFVASGLSDRGCRKAYDAARQCGDELPL